VVEAAAARSSRKGPSKFAAGHLWDASASMEPSNRRRSSGSAAAGGAGAPVTNDLALPDHPVHRGKRGRGVDFKSDGGDHAHPEVGMKRARDEALDPTLATSGPGKKAKAPSRRSPRTLLAQLGGGLFALVGPGPTKMGE